MDTKIESKKDVRKQEGFTLIEILVVVGMIALLAAIVLIAINPARQFAQGRNTQRTSNVEAILNAVGQNMADNKGVFTCGSETIDATEKEICAGTDCVSSDTIDLACIVPNYMPALPLDPIDGNATTEWSNYTTGYTISQDAANNRITVKAPSAELGLAIEITR